MKKIVIISSSPRKNGNSETLAQKFRDGAISAGNSATIISVRDINPKFCIGCFACQTTGKCVLNDGMNEVCETVRNADVLVFATPVYYYSVCGQLKTFLDRLNPLFPKDNKFKEVYLLATAAEDEETTFDGTIKDIQGWIDCFEGVTFRGVLKAGGVNDIGDVNSTDYLEQAYKTGANV